MCVRALNTGCDRLAGCLPEAGQEDVPVLQGKLETEREEDEKKKKRDGEDGGLSRYIRASIIDLCSSRCIPLIDRGARTRICFETPLYLTQTGL